MKRWLWTFDQVDTWFFRDSGSFNVGEAVNIGKGIFPPSMQTMQGAIRVALARGQGWHPLENDVWPVELGNTQSLGNLVLEGPYLVRQKQDEWEVLLPAPALLVVGGDNGQVLSRLEPGKRKYECDIDPERGVRLPKAKHSLPGLRSLQGYWLTRSGWQEILDGEIPQKRNMVAPAQLWKDEPRTGIGLAVDTKTAMDGELYMSTHTRLSTQEIALGAVVTGIPSDWHAKAAKIVNLGGESRLASIKISQVGNSIMPAVPNFIPQHEEQQRLTVSLLTPGRFGTDTAEVLRNGPTEIPFQAVSACIYKMGQISGWDSATHRPLPLEPVIPPGSTWFYEIPLDKLGQVLGLHSGNVGYKTEYGYGQVVLGKWG